MTKPKTPTPAPLSDYQIATVRLEAWKAIEGWGHSKPNGGINAFGWDERCREAARLAQWAMSKGTA